MFLLNLKEKKENKQIHIDIERFNEVRAMDQLIAGATGSMVKSISYKYSDAIFYNYLKLSRKLAGFRVKYTERRNTSVKSGGVWCYAEHGTRTPGQPTCVFLHGFGGDKDSWTSMVKHIGDFHCILLDLPGHGETTFVDSHDQYSIESFVKNIREFLEVIGLDKEKIFLVGFSFGGVLATLYAHDYSDNINKLALLAPGFKTPVYSQIANELDAENFENMIPDNSKKLAHMFEKFYYKKPRHFKYPNLMFEAIMRVQYSQSRQKFLHDLLTSFVREQKTKFESDFKARIKALSVRTLVVWGRDDSMIDLSGAYMLKKLIRNSELRIVDKCNHMIHFDRPREAVGMILDFFIT